MRNAAAITIAMALSVIVALFVALATVTPLAFAALGLLPIIQYRLMSLLES
jgi:hypothetical protein